MIMRMVEVREALENVVMHRKIVEYVATLSIARMLYKLIHSQRK